MSSTSNIDPRGYYQSLTKKEKGKFLRYLSLKFDYPQSTMSGKLRASAVSDLRRDETENIVKVIASEAWRR